MAEEKGFVSKLKENYLNFIESLSEKGIPSPHLIVPLVVIIAIGAAFLLVPGIAVEKRNVGLTLKDSLSRPVSGAVVDVILNNATITSSTSDASGKVSFTDLSVNAQLRISAEGYAVKTRNVNELSQQSTISLQASGPPTADVALRILDSTSQPINGAFVQLSFANGDFAPQVTSDAGGNAVVTIQESQIGQSTATVNAPGFETTQQAISQEEIESGTPILITLEPQGDVSQTHGGFTVRVTSNSNGVENALVSLIDVVTNSVTASERTSSDGSVLFQETAFGTAFTIRVSHAAYNQAEMEFTPTAHDNEASIQLTTRTSPASTITLTVVDEELSPLNAVVNLFDANTNSLLETGETNSAGEFTASVATNINAYATAYADGYLPSYLGDLRGGSTRSITLQQALPGNSVPLTTVVLQDGFPASNAEVSLYRSGGFFLGIPAFRVGSSGIGNVTIPTTIDGATYRVFANASKGAFYGKSDLVEVSSVPVSLSVNLLAIPANVTIALKDLSTGQLIPSGSIEAVVANLPVSTCTVSNGTCILPVAANKQFSIHASATGYLTYSTTQQAYSPGEKTNLTISLFPISLAQGATVTFLGLFDSQNAKVTEVVNADTYNAKFAVNLPQNAQQAGFYFQVGDEQSVEESVASIANFDSNGASFVQSDSQLATNASCYAGQSTPNSDDKWAYFSFPRGFIGTKEFSFKVKISRTAEPGTNFNLHYKAFAFKDNLPLLAPADPDLLQTLRQKIDAGSQLVPEDTCAMKTFDQAIPVSQQTLRCDENNICTKATLSDLTSRGSASTFQPQIARDFTFEFEVLSPVSIDSAAIVTQHFNVKNSQQVLASASLIMFQQAPDAVSSSTSSNGRQFNLPFTTLANRKGKISMTLTPLKVSQSAPLTFILRAGDKSYSIPVILSISGTNTFTVTAAPQQIPANQEGRITVVVRDRTARPVEDASVSLFECSNSPFSGNEPSQLTGDSTLNNGQNGRYRIDVTPTGLGEIGVRVESPDFKTFENCLVSVSGGDFISISPDVMEFTGSSIEPQAQQASVSNLLNEPIQVSTSINCGGDPVPARIFPTSTTIEPNSDSTFSVKLLQNTTSTSQCLAYFSARVGSFKSTQELPISFNVNCPDCALAISTGSANAPLPPAVTLYATPPFFQDSLSIPLRLSADPTCTLDGFRINPAGIYAAPLSPAGGVLGGIPRPNLWNCAACGPADATGASQCNSCQQLVPSAYQCGACRPASITAPTSSSLPSHGVATCNQCASAYDVYQANAFASQLAFQGRGVPYSPVLGPMQQPHNGAYLPGFLAPGQQLSYDPVVGALLRQDNGISSNFYSPRFGVQPILPGSPLVPSFNGYNRQSGFSQNILRDSLRVDQCTKDAITISADYSFLGQGFPGTGNLFVTLPDGTRKTIRVNVWTVPVGSAVQQTESLAVQCGTGQTVEAEINPGYKLNATVSLSCSTPFDQKQVQSVETLNGEAIQSSDCTVDLNNNDLKVSCDFSKNEKAKEILSHQNALVIRARVFSSQNPNADLAVTIKATFEKVTVPPKEVLAPVETPEPPQTEPPRPPTPSVSLKVYKQSDTSNHDLCGERIQSGTPLKLVYSFKNDNAASRQVLITKQETTGWIDAGSITPDKLASSSGSIQYQLKKAFGAPATQKFSFKAVSNSASGAIEKTCELTATDKPPMIKQIKAAWVYDLPFKEFKWLYPEHFVYIATQLELDSDLIKSKANRKKVKAITEYICQNGNSHIVTHEYLLTSKYEWNETAAYDASIDSLEFTKCKPQVDSDIAYQIKVTLQTENGVELETAYYVPGKPAVTEAAQAGVMIIANYPEAPPINEGVSTLPSIDVLNLNTLGAFDNCGRLSATTPLLNSIKLFRVPPLTGLREVFKSSDTIYPNQQLAMQLCTTKNLVAGKTHKFKAFVEYTSNYGYKESVPLGNCTINTLGQCEVTFNSDAFLSPDKITASRIDLAKPIAFTVRIDEDNVEVSGTERYFCKYWPLLNSQCGRDDADKALFKVSAKDPRKYDLSNHCQVDPGNKNILTCDLEEGEEIEIPGKMRFNFAKLTEVDANFNAYYGTQNGAHGDTFKMPCNTNFRIAEDVGEWRSCYDGGLTTTLGALDPSIATPFVAASFLGILSAGTVGYGRSAPIEKKIAKVKIVTQFSADKDWLKNNYPDNYNLRDSSGVIRRKVAFVEKPILSMFKLGQALGKSLSGDETQGVYILGPFDIARVVNGDQNGNSVLVSYLGLTTDNDKYAFQVRRRDKPIIQDCHGDLAGKLALSGLAGVAAGLACIAPGINVGVCPFVVGGLGAAGGAAVGSAVFTDSMLSIDTAGKGITETVECDKPNDLVPNVVVKVLKQFDSVANPEGGTFESICVLIASEISLEQIKGLELKPDEICKKT